MKHNKRRNVALMYEFLTRHIAEAVVDGDGGQVRKAVKLLKKHFREGTELHKEFRLARALAGSYVTDRKTAERIVETARSAARSYDAAKLDREKSLLIRGINHTFNDDAFYDRRVDEYKLLATVQTLLNEWRNDVPTDVVQLALYEAELVEHLIKPKDNNVLDEGAKPDVDDLVVNLMLKKVNAKYNGLLSPEQVRLLNTYVDARKNGDETQVRALIEGLKASTLKALDAYALEQKDNPDVISRLDEIRGLVSQPDGEVDDQVLARYLRIARLRHEILGD